MSNSDATHNWPPGPPGRFLVGNLPELAGNWLETLSRYADAFGDFVPLRLGPKRAVLLSHPSFVEDVLLTNNRAFIKSLALRNSRRIFGDGLVTSEGEPWLSQRRLLQPLMHHQHVGSYAQTMIEATQQLLARWRNGEARDLYADLSQLTLDIVARTLFGTGITHQEAADVGRCLAVALAGFDRRISGLQFLLPDTLPVPGHMAYLKAARCLDEIIYGIIERGRRHRGDSNNLLSVLLEARDSGGRRLTDRQIRDEVVSMIVAGHETTATTLVWVFVLLEQNPDIEERLVCEIERSLDGRPISGATRLPYVEWVVAETLRLYPTSWVIAREAITACSIGPYRVERGTVILMSQWVVHRDSRFFEDPLSFRPQRWANNLAKQLPRFAYFPFGGGPRVCIGNAFTALEMVLLLATIVRQFRVTLAADATVLPHPSATLRPSPPPHVVVSQRWQHARRAAELVQVAT